MKRLMPAKIVHHQPTPSRAMAGSAYSGAKAAMTCALEHEGYYTHSHHGTPR